MMSREQEEAKEKTIREVERPKSGEELDPWIVIDKLNNPRDDRIRIRINPAKLMRVLSNKNLIMNALDIILVDKIKELLENLAKREERAEEDMKNFGGKKNGTKIQQSGPAKPDDTKHGHSGTKTGKGRFV